MGLINVHRNVIDVAEFARFVLTGIIATLGNIGAVWISRLYLSFSAALVTGLLTGFLISFILSKLVAFRSRSWDRAQGEIARFLSVYAVGALVYWAVGYSVGSHVLNALLNQQQAELGGALIGAAMMTFTSYFGHRFFTYRTFGQKSMSDLRRSALEKPRGHARAHK